MPVQNTRFPFLVLPYSMKHLAVPKELMIDYDTGVAYVRSPDGTTDMPLILPNDLIGPHIQDKDNPHEVNKEQVGLDNVENYPVASLEEALAGVRTDRYLTPFLLKKVLEQYGGGITPPPPPPETYSVDITTIPSDANVDVYYNGQWTQGKTHTLPDGEYDYRAYTGAQWEE